MRLLPLIVGLALLGTLASVFALSRNPAPVQYPPDWPPGWLHAPRGASAAALPASLELNRTMLAESHPWHPVDSMGVANEGRSWHVGFAYAGSFDAAQRDIAGIGQEHGIDPIRQEGVGRRVQCRIIAVRGIDRRERGDRHDGARGLGPGAGDQALVPGMGHTGNRHKGNALPCRAPGGAEVAHR